MLGLKPFDLRHLWEFAMPHQSTQATTSEPPNSADSLPSSPLQPSKEVMFAGSHHICYGSVFNIQARAGHDLC